ncbi:hypothetical protein ILUMI_19450, partial [Ignelater luminosus]
IDGLTGEVDTYGSVLQRSILAAITMRSKGVTPPEEEKEFIPVEIRNLKETLSIFSSSRTSGLAMGVCLSHLSLISQFSFMEVKKSLGFVTLNYSSPCWATSVVMLTTSILTSACRLLLFVSGSTIYKEQLDKIKQLLPTTITELGGNSLAFDLNPSGIASLVQKSTSCDKPLIVDLQTKEALGPNQKGKLRVKTDYCINVYYDDDYCFYVVDRIKDMLKFQGWQIAPAKLETILLSHPVVETALVIGLPDPVDCDHLTGIVQVKKSAKNVIVEDMQKYYDEKIDDDRYRLRGGLKIDDSIPVTPTGKYKKQVMILSFVILFTN